MKVFTVKYVLKNGQTMDVGVIAQSREQSVHALMDVQKGVDTVIGINIGPEVHIIATQVKSLFPNENDGKIKELKKKNIYLKNCLMDSDDHIASLMKEADKRISPVVVDTSENEMLMNKVIELETKLMKPNEVVDNSLIDKLNTKVLQLEQENNELKSAKPKSAKPTEYVCNECGKTYKTSTGLTAHMKKIHKVK